MTRNRIFLLPLIFLVLYSCTTGKYWKIKLELPVKTNLDISQYKNIVIANFFLKDDKNDFEINPALLEYLSSELSQELDKNISTKNIVLDNEEIFQNKDFWKGQAPEEDATAFLTGSIEYTAETRKALIGKSKKQFDNPFPNKNRLASRKFYSLKMNVYFINAATGEVIYDTNFNETQAYENPNQTAEFAFFDQIHKVKEKLFRQILGGERIQQRYLISK
jgi:hypothetical protein